MLARARIAALILSLTLIIGAIMSPAWGCINGQTLGEIIWITIDAESFLAGFGDVVTSKDVLVLRSQQYVNEKLRGYPSSHLLFSCSTQNSLYFLVRPYNSLCNNETWYIGIREGRFIAREDHGSTMGFYRQIDRWSIVAVFPVWVNVPSSPSWIEAGREYQSRQNWINKRALASIICRVLFSERINGLVRLHARVLHDRQLATEDDILRHSDANSYKRQKGDSPSGSSRTSSRTISGILFLLFGAALLKVALDLADAPKNPIWLHIGAWGLNMK
jgi:hypothetical protein